MPLGCLRPPAFSWPPQPPLTFTLSNPSGAVIDEAEATGTIENNDALPRALMARFGRTAAMHVVEHVEERLQAPREPGFRATNVQDVGVDHRRLEMSGFPVVPGRSGSRLLMRLAPTDSQPT